MTLRCVNHLAFITNDIVKTVRFYRDLLGMQLTAGIGHDGYRHYFFRMGDQASHVAFFEYEGAQPMNPKFPGNRTTEPIGFDHVSFTVDSREDLFALKDTLEAAGLDVHGAVDHGLFWSIYFFDPNGIPLEATWEMMEITQFPAIEDDDPLDIAAEGAEPQQGHWPEVTTPTPRSQMVAKSGNGLPMRESFLKQGVARYKNDADITAA
jgi:catechol 2,3-dioxygenase-like lactoylglutathione lyase family enzyme|tara:strand:- start:72 stop:695 length:624 start_codon:yes stop_codon:yes gene_type:complete